VVNPVDDPTPLERPLHLKPAASQIKVLATIGDAASLIAKLDEEGNADGHYWTDASSALFAANEEPGNTELLGHATDAVAEALRQDGLLVAPASESPPGPRASWLSRLLPRSA